MKHFPLPREFYIPRGAVKVSDRHSDAVAYLYPCRNAGWSNGKPAAVVFYGQQSKPVARHYYLTEAQRETEITKHFKARQDHIARKETHVAERKAAAATKLFDVGKTYSTRSACDWDTVYSFEIVSRTAKRLTIRERNETYKRGIYVYEGVEHCKPHGTYSMCAVISADRNG